MKHSVIGLGSGGVALARAFEQYPQYRVYKIDSEPSKEKRYYALKRHETPESFESEAPKLKTFFRSLSGSVLFIVCGSGLVSAASLVILEQLKACKIDILYIRPDTELLNNSRQLLEKTTFGVLQEYTRSGVFESMVIVSNPVIEKLIGDIPILGFYDKLNEQIVPPLHYINIFKNTKPVVDNFAPPSSAARITTIGVVSLDRNEEELFYPLKDITEKQYYYAINQKQMETDGLLFRSIKTQIKGKQSDTIKVSYGIYTTEHETNYVLCVARSTQIQRV